MFYAYLGDDRASYDIASIQQYLRETKDGKHKIFTSSLALAEVVPSAIKRPDVGSFEDFMRDFQGAIVTINPSPNVMFMASKLKDLPYRKQQAKPRRLSTTDAIMLASCLELAGAYGVNVDIFHTFDNGKKRDPVDGKMCPLISYEEWCEGFSADQMKVAGPVIALNRRRPIHPKPDILDRA